MIRTLVVDDEVLGRQRLRTLLADEPDVDLVGFCTNGQEAVDAITRLVPDLVFLDVQMPLLDGFEVLEAIDPVHMPVVIFVTAYDQYALRAFDVYALDYLLKPFDRDRFQKALARALHHLQHDRLDALQHKIQGLLSGLPSHRPAYLERLSVKTAGQVYFINVQEIDWIEAAGNYACLHVNDRQHLVRETMGHLTECLDPARFLRIHRSTIINLDQLATLTSLPHGEYLLTLHNGTRLTSGRSYRAQVQALRNRLA